MWLLPSRCTLQSLSLFFLHIFISTPRIKGVPKGSLAFKCAKRDRHLAAPSFTLTTMLAVNRSSSIRFKKAIYSEMCVLSWFLFFFGNLVFEGFEMEMSWCSLWTLFLNVPVSRRNDWLGWKLFWKRVSLHCEAVCVKYFDLFTEATAWQPAIILGVSSHCWFSKINGFFYTDLTEWPPSD